MDRKGPKRQSRKPRPDKPVYIQSPLVETVFEIQFLGEPAVECRRDEFFTAVRDQFPRVWVPPAEPGKAVALQPYLFRSKDEAETVMVAINRFAYATRQYPGFAAFQSRALGLAQRFCRKFGIDRLTRTGLRYVNVIPFLREGGVIPWRRYFTVGLTLPATSPDDFINVGMTFESRCHKGVITTRIACGKTADGSKEVFLLDFDFAKTEQLRAKEIRTYIEESHDHTKRVFEGITTEDYKAVMRGQVIE